MGMLVLSASAQGLYAPTYPISTPPWTVAFWVKPRTTKTFSTCFCFCTASGTTGWLIGSSSVSATTVSLWGWDGAAEVGVASVSTAWVAGAWSFVIARNFSATNRRISVLKSTNVVAHGSNTTNTTVTTGAAAIGDFRISSAFNNDPLNGTIAELSIWNDDILPGGAGGAMTDDFVRQLAFNGPFATGLTDKLVEYRSFRGPDKGETGSVLLNREESDVWRKYGANYPWQPFSTPALDWHPPLATPYRRFLNPAPTKLII